MERMFYAAVGAVGWQGMLNTTVSGPTVFVAQEQGDTLAAYCYPFAVRKRKLATAVKRVNDLYISFLSHISAAGGGKYRGTEQLSPTPSSFFVPRPPSPTITRQE